MADHLNLGKLLKKRRLEKGLTQSQLGEALGGLQTQFVSSWEKGGCAPPSRSLPSLIKILEIEEDTLVEVMIKDARVAIQRRVYPKKKKA